MYLGMSQTEAENTGDRGTDEGGKLKEASTTHWESPNTGATNTSGFSALPGGYRDAIMGRFYDVGYYAYFWTSTGFGSKPWSRLLFGFKSVVNRANDYKQDGFSVRLIRD